MLSSGTEADGIVCNGMSNYNRNSPFANAAVVVSIDHEKTFGADIFGGLKMRRALESKAYQAVRSADGTRELPTQNLMDFMNGTSKEALLPGSSPSGAVKTALHEILPSNMAERIREGLEAFNVSMKGFLNNDAQVYGVESRTSCPLRITRDAETLESVSHAGLFPAGEGAGYAGGITSAACDGIKIAEKIMEQFTSARTGAEATQK